MLSLSLKCPFVIDSSYHKELCYRNLPISAVWGSKKYLAVLSQSLKI